MIRRVSFVHVCCVATVALVACGSETRGSSGAPRTQTNPPGEPPAPTTPPAPPGTPMDEVPLPPVAPSARSACDGLVPPFLPPSVTYTEEVRFSDMCDEGKTDGQGAYVALRTGDGMAAAGKWPLYRFVPSRGGAPTGFTVGGRAVEPGVTAGFVWALERGFLRRPTSGGLLVGTVGPAEIYADTGAFVARVETTGTFDDFQPAPHGGGVAATETHDPDRTPSWQSHLEAIDGDGRVTARFDGPLHGGSSYNPMSVVAVTAGGNVLARHAGLGLRWFDAQLVPMTDWFTLRELPYVLAALPLADGGLALPGPDGALLLRDGRTTATPGPEWLRARELGLVPVRGGAGYAALARHAATAVEVVAADGTPCGEVQLPVDPDARLSIGRDGTVFATTRSTATAATGEPPPAVCTWRWWPALLGRVTHATSGTR